MGEDYKVKIIEYPEEPEGTCYFLFCSIKTVNNKYTGYEDTKYGMDGAFRIYDEDVHCFIRYFLEKHFDPELTYNKERPDVAIQLDENVFDWYGSSYYTYDSIKKMCLDILDVSRKLKNDYDNPLLDAVKKNYRIFWFVSEDDLDYELRDDLEKEAIKRHIDVAVDFYERFVDRIMSMIIQNNEADIVGVFGP